MSLSEEKVKELITLYRKGDLEARDSLVEHNLALVSALAKKFQDRGDLEDLKQVGSIGLIKAIERFDIGRGVKFSTYAVSLIVGEMRQYLRDRGDLIKVGRRLRTRIDNIQKMRANLLQTLKREPTISELAAELKISPEEILLAEEAREKAIFIEETYQFPVVDEKEKCFEEEITDRLFLQAALSRLCGRERQLITMRYFQEKTQQEVALCLGISQTHVSRLERKILQKLKNG
jgi:RNA polymerase sporulation-specific sigma factor